MSPVRTPARERRERAYRRYLRAEMVRVAAFVEREVRLGLAVLDEPMPGAEHGVVIEGRIEGDRVIVDGD
jgi:hypothetical protein